jgi:hypothetical protein
VGVGVGVSVGGTVGLGVGAAGALVGVAVGATAAGWVGAGGVGNGEFCPPNVIPGKAMAVPAMGVVSPPGALIGDWPMAVAVSVMVTLPVAPPGNGLFPTGVVVEVDSPALPGMPIRIDVCRVALA